MIPILLPNDVECIYTDLPIDGPLYEHISFICIIGPRSVKCGSI